MAEQRCRHSLFIIFSLVLLSSELGFSRASTTAVPCHESERKALMEIRRGLSDPSRRLSSWVGDACCNNWEGVGCDNITGHVIKLDLRTRYTDPPMDICFADDISQDYVCRKSLCGDLSSSLRSLQHLTYLDLSGNSFENRGLLQLLVSFEELMYLNLSCSGLRGKVPYQLGNLFALHHVDLSYNELHLKNAGWISQLTSLQSFDMNEVSFKEVPNWLQALNALPRIQEVQLVHCDLSALPQTLPHRNFTYLTVLDLSYNDIVSSPPDWLFTISSLEYLNLGGNGIHWRQPSSIGNLNALRSLILSGNTFTGGLQLGALSNLCNLQILDLSHASLYDELYNLESAFSGCLQFSLEELDLSNNILHGFLPDWLGKMNNLKYLDLSHNSLQASVPASLGNLSVLRYLDISSNNLSWTSAGVDWFPSSLEHLDLSNNLFPGHFSSRITDTMPNFLLPICQMKNIRVIRLENNGLSGELPDCWSNSSKLINLDISGNNFYGGIPNTLCSMPNLQGLYLARNNLSGQIPSHLKDCKNLVILELSNNNFNGKIPHWISDSIPSLRALILRSNSFSGKIPQLSHLAHLQILDLSNNYFDGSVTQDFGNFQGLKDILQTNTSSYGDDLNDNVQLFIKGRFLWYNHKSLPFLKIIDISNNHLSGRIPQELWDLDRMISLNLSGNQLIGEISNNIGGLKILEVLDLARNNLSGKIPSSLADLNFLSILNLSYNNFHGKIPHGIQLQTFDSFSYIGNPYLYGPPLTPYNNSEDKEYIDKKPKTSWKCGSMAIGFGIGILAISGIFMLQRKWKWSIA